MPKMNYSQLKKNISSGNLKNIYFLQGEEYLVEYFEQNLKKQILSENYSDFDISVFSEENLNLNQLSVALETFPAISSSKLVIIHNLPLEMWNSENLDEFINIIKDIPDFAHLIISQISIVTGAKNTSKLQKIQKVIDSTGIISCFSKKDIPIEKQLIFWAKKEFNKNLSPEYAEFIKKTCENHSVTLLKNELKKVCQFESTENITKESLNILISSKSKTGIFNLPKVILEKNAKKAFEILENLLEQKEEPVSIVSVLGNEYIDLYRVKCYTEEGINLSELSKNSDYKGKEFRIKNAEKHCKNIDISKIKQCLNYILQADIKLKTTQIDPKSILAELITQLLI